MTTQNEPLLELKTRVKHYDGDPETGHGKGTIVAYNGAQPNAYLEEKPEEAIKMAAEAGLLAGLINSMYGADRYPYVVQWDINERLKAEYPNGYKDVYGRTDLNPFTEEE